MSGHSHAKTIKREKNITDQKRGQVFSKMARVISVAVREGGPNPETNSKLRLAFEMAKEANMPKDNIERAIKRGAGQEPSGEQLEGVIFEAYGPGGTAMIIEGITDNRKRTQGEIKQILSRGGGKLVGEGSVKWMFERKGCITINFQLLISNSQFKNKEELEIAVIEAGAEDIYWREELLDVYTKPDELEKVKRNLEEKGIQTESASLDWVAREEVPVEENIKETCRGLFEALDENDAVQEIYSNIKLP